MEFDESLQQYVYQYEDLIFSWDEEPKEQYINKVKALAKNYKDNFDRIIFFSSSVIGFILFKTHLKYFSLQTLMFQW